MEERKQPVEGRRAQLLVEAWGVFAKDGLPPAQQLCFLPAGIGQAAVLQVVQEQLVGTPSHQQVVNFIEDGAVPLQASGASDLGKDVVDVVQKGVPPAQQGCAFSGERAAVVDTVVIEAAVAEDPVTHFKARLEALVLQGQLEPSALDALALGQFAEVDAILEVRRLALQAQVLGHGARPSPSAQAPVADGAAVWPLAQAS